jgi:Bacterial protein of unknown function (DUF882)
MKRQTVLRSPGREHASTLLLGSLVAVLLGLAPAFAHAAPNKEAQVAPKNGSPASKAKTVASAKQAGSAKGPCYAKPVALMRVRGTVVEPREVSLTYCDGKPNPAAVDTVSLLARPRDVERPLLPEIRAYRARPLLPKKLANTKATVKNAAALAKSKKKYRDPMFVTEQVMRIDPGLLARLQKVANRYPGKTIEIISGYRPDARETSRHHHGRALDLRVAGVTREKLRDFVRTFEKTGVGYYPNSYFVHMDVREDKGYWVDRAGPGEPADYGPWPPTKQELDKQRDSVLQNALAAISRLGNSNGGAQTFAQASPVRTAQGARQRVSEPENEPDDMKQDEIARVRDEARRALEQL